jgi:DNA-binding LacI/PurR family transcriptional regulator
MRDIAKAAGVSQSTVSRVLSGTASAVSIGPEARERVLAVADRLGYRPNPLARGLRGASTMLLGVIVREIMDPFFAAAVEAITNESRARGYNLVLGQAHGRADEAIALRSVLETRHVDAMLILGDMRDQPRLIDDLRASSVPAVALWQGTALPGIATVNGDNAAGIRAALDLVTGFGHERIGLIVGRPLGDIQARRAAYLDYMTEQGLVRDSYVMTVANDPAGGVSAMKALLHLEEPPTAVLATTDVLAIVRCTLPTLPTSVSPRTCPWWASTTSRSRRSQCRRSRRFGCRLPRWLRSRSGSRSTRVAGSLRTPSRPSMSSAPRS